MAGVQPQRFWCRTAEGLGIGVTAPSKGEAQRPAREAADRSSLNFAVLEVIPDIDIRTRDQDHVVPNMGPPSVQGAWFPRLNI